MKRIIGWALLGLLSFGGCSPASTESAGSCSLDSRLACQTGWVGYRCTGDAAPSGDCGPPNATTSGFFSTEPGTYCCSKAGAGNPKCDGPIGCLAPQDCPSGMYCGCAACGFYCGQCKAAPSCGSPNPQGYTLCDSSGNCPNGGSCEMTAAGFKACTGFDKCVSPTPAAGGAGGAGAGGRGGAGGAAGSGGASTPAGGGTAGAVISSSGGSHAGSDGTISLAGEGGASPGSSDAGAGGAAGAGEAGASGAGAAAGAG